MEVLDGHWTESTGHWHESTEHKRESTGLERIWKPEQKVDPVPGLSTYNCQKSTDDGPKRVQQFPEVQIKLWLDRVQCCLYKDSNHNNTCACATDNDCIYMRETTTILTKTTTNIGLVTIMLTRQKCLHNYVYQADDTVWKVMFTRQSCSSTSLQKNSYQAEEKKAAQYWSHCQKLPSSKKLTSLMKRSWWLILIMVIGHHQSFSFFGEGYFDCDKTTDKCVDKSAPDADIDTRYTRWPDAGILIFSYKPAAATQVSSFN